MTETKRHGERLEKRINTRIIYASKNHLIALFQLQILYLLNKKDIYEMNLTIQSAISSFLWGIIKWVLPWKPAAQPMAESLKKSIQSRLAQFKLD